MTSAQILSIPMGSRNSLAGNAQKVIPVRMKFPLEASVLFLPDFVCGCLGVPEAGGASASHSAQLRGARAESRAKHLGGGRRAGS